MKMGIELRLRDLKFSEWGSFEPTADEWVVRETDDAVYEKLLGIVCTITQMQEHLRSLVLYHTGGTSGAAKLVVVHVRAWVCVFGVCK